MYGRESWRLYGQLLGNAFGFVLHSDQLNVISINDRFLKLCAEGGVNGVDDIAVSAVGIFSAGHNDKELVTGVDDLDIVNCKLSVECNRDNGLHRSVVKKLSYFDVSYLHFNTSKKLTYFLLCVIKTVYFNYDYIIQPFFDSYTTEISFLCEDL